MEKSTTATAATTVTASKERQSSPSTAIGKVPFDAKSSPDLPKLYVLDVEGFFAVTRSASPPPEPYISEDSHAHLLRNLLKVHDIQRGRLSCIFSVRPPFTNVYKGLHGGVVASIAERVSIACARTVVAEDKQLFLGELSMSYLSAATIDDLVMVDTSVVRSGRNLSVVATEFRIKKTGKLVYLARATFYHTSVSKL